MNKLECQQKVRDQLDILLDGTQFNFEDEIPVSDFSDGISTLVQEWKIWDSANKMHIGRIMVVWDTRKPLDEMRLLYYTTYECDYIELKSIFQYFPHVNKDRS